MIIDRLKYKTQKDFISALVENKQEIAEMKKSVLKFSECFVSSGENELQKSISTSNVDDLQSGEIKRTIIANTYNWLDSHGDVHLNGVFSKSISERVEKVWHLHDHEYKLTAKVGKPINVYEKNIAWRDLGINKSGVTQALFLDSLIKKEMNEEIFKMYLNGEIDQHSVGMIYVKLDLAVNDSDFKDEFSVWNKYIDLIGNKEKANELGYFWAIKEAKLKEISAVLEGSNELTPTVENIEPSKIIQTTEPVKTAQINYEYLKTNIKL